MLTSRQLIPSALSESGLMAIIRTATAADAEASALALADAGVRMLEISLVVPGALAALRRVRSALPAEILVGAGTVLDAADAEAALEHGAEFLVAPGLSPEVAAIATRAAVGFYPGALTPSEIIAAWEAGATAVKVFPAGALGAGYLRAVREPLPGIPLLAVGGVSVESIPEFFAAGAIGVGLGSILQSHPSRALAAVAAAR